MAVSGISGSSAALTTGLSDREDVSQAEFLRLLVAEIVNQNPLEPMDSAQFATQLTQLQSLRNNVSLTDNMAKLLQQQQVTSAGTMLGAVVRGTTDSGLPIQGNVTGVQINGDDVRVVLNGQLTVRLDRIQEILIPSADPPAGDGSSESTPTTDGGA